MASKYSPSMNGSDLRCPVCGQGFLLYSEARTPQSKEWERDEVREQLRLHHELGISHPVTPFPISAPPERTEKSKPSFLHPILAV